MDSRGRTQSALSRVLREAVPSPAAPRPDDAVTGNGAVAADISTEAGSSPSPSIAVPIMQRRGYSTPQRSFTRSAESRELSGSVGGSYDTGPAMPLGTPFPYLLRYTPRTAHPDGEPRQNVSPLLCWLHPFIGVSRPHAGHAARDRRPRLVLPSFPQQSGLTHT